MTNKKPSFSDGIRAAIDVANRAGISRYRICCETRIDQAAMSRFMAGKCGLELAAIDRLAEMLGFWVVGAVVKTPRKPKTTQGKAAPVKR